MISIHNLHYTIIGRSLLEGTSFQINKDQHVGLIGRNGSGKSTLFNLILGKLTSEQGTIDIPRSCTILTVQQDMPEGHLTPIEYLLNEDKERTALFKELETATAPQRISDICERLLEIDAYSAEARAAKILKGLGFDEENQNRPLDTFSGGFRMRVALASILFQEPDLLLLDEPTNHLDFETTRWLEKFLKNYPKAFLLISHDRDFLNATVDHIIHLKNAKTTKYTGNFDTFITTYELQQANITAYNKKMTEKREHMMKFVNRYRALASKAKQAQSRLKSIEKMTFIPVEKDDPTISFQFPQPDHIAPPMINYERVSVGYDDKVILRYITGSINPQDRIALVGTNGSGKTTFARFLAGDLAPLSGVIEVNQKCKVAFYRQDQFEMLQKDKTVYEHIESILENANDLQIRTHLGRFGFAKEKSEQKVENLSGGERARLLFACLTAEKPNILILDEPTNHLDMEMRESLINALNAYEGSVILITHDRHLLRHVADQLWLVKNASVKAFDGDIENYERYLIS